MILSEIIRQHPTATARQIAEAFGIDPQTVRRVRWRDTHLEAARRNEERRRREQGVLPMAEYHKRRSNARWPAKDVAIVERNWGRRPVAEIADLVGKTRNAVIGKAHRLGLPRLK